LENSAASGQRKLERVRLTRSWRIEGDRVASTQAPVNIAILDDYQNVAFKLVDWSRLQGRSHITVFDDHVSDPVALVERLKPFEVISVMRERTPLPRSIIEQLPNLKLIASNGMRNASIDVAAAKDCGITVCGTGYSSTATVELTWALIHALVRNLPAEHASVRSGGWQLSVGDDLHGKTLGTVGLGNIGSRVAKVAHAFGMIVIVWSQNLTHEKAEEHGARLVAKEQLFREADIVTVHLVLSKRTIGTIGATELELMKPTAYLINTSRGPLITECALVAALKNHKIAGAALDVYDIEPLPFDHPFRSIENAITTPHIGYVTRGIYETFYLSYGGKHTCMAGGKAYSSNGVINPSLFSPGRTDLHDLIQSASKLRRRATSA
jgi:phosphoglycerate dehydrogenase-like enzyme